MSVEIYKGAFNDSFLDNMNENDMAKFKDLTKEIMNKGDKLLKGTAHNQEVCMMVANMSLVIAMVEKNQI